MVMMWFGVFWGVSMDRKEKNAAVVHGPKKATASMATDRLTPPHLRSVWINQLIEGGGATQGSNEATQTPTHNTPNQKTPISLTQESKNQSKLYTPKSPGSLAGGSRGSQRNLRKLLFRELIPSKTSKFNGIKDSKNSKITKIFGIP